jgi:hypothetical protein
MITGGVRVIKNKNKNKKKNILLFVSYEKFNNQIKANKNLTNLKKKLLKKIPSTQKKKKKKKKN